VGVVGVCLSRSEMLPVALLAVLKSGAAYLPLDPAFPADRTGFAIAKTKTALVLAERRTASTLPEGTPLLLCEEVLNAPNASPTSAIQPGSVAYVMFTSGSTGRPKGVSVRQSSVVNFLHSMAECPGISESDVMVAVTTPAFDISVLELFLPLAVGARV